MSPDKNLDKMLEELLGDYSKSEAADEEFTEMQYRQQEYEESLMGYPPDHPSVRFKHSFLRTGYLPVTVVKCKHKEPDPKKVAKRLCDEAYIANSRGIRKLNHGRFCKIWSEEFQYIYSGFILTPDGQIDAETFRSDLVKMLLIMDSEMANIDSIAEHLFKTYIYGYKIDAYKEDKLIPFRNGDLVLNDGNKGFTFYKGRKTPVPYRFDYDFNNIPNCLEPEFPNFKEWRDGLFDEEDQYTLKQMLGYLLLPVNTAQEAFFIVGKGGTGKSIITDCIIPTMLKGAIFPMSISLFFNNQFQSSISEGKLCIVDDDIGETHLTNDGGGRFKNFVSAETIQIEHKYCSPTIINNSARIVCSGNHMIYSDDKTDGFTRRLHPIYVKPRVIAEEDIDTQFKAKIKKEIPMIVLWALEGLLELLSRKNRRPYWSERSKTQFEHYAEGQKWEEQFITENYMYSPNTVTYSNDIKDVLNEWIKNNAEVSGERSLYTKYCSVIQWLKDEGADKFGFVYKRGIKKGDNYNARGYINMCLKEPVKNPMIFTNEQGKLMLRTGGKKKVDSEEEL